MNELSEEFQQKYSQNTLSEFKNTLFCSINWLFKRIPINDAEQMILKYWDVFGFTHSFLTSALYVGTDKTLQLAVTKINLLTKDEKLQVWIYFSEDDNESILFNERFLNNISSYFDKIDFPCLLTFAEKYYNQTISTTLKRQLIDHLSPFDKPRFKSKDDYYWKELLDRYLETNQLNFLYIEIELEKYSIEEKNNLIYYLEKWLKINVNNKNNAFKAYQIVSECIKHIGNRKDLDLLINYADKIHNGEKTLTPVLIEELIDNTTFYLKRRTLS